MSAAYAGEGKTDAKDAYVIAETARLRRDLAAIGADTDLVRNLAVLTAYRADLIADRVRMLNRLRDLMTSVFPSLERAFDYSAHKGALVLLTGYASPERIRRLGESRLAGWLRHRHVRGAAGLAARAVTAAKAQLTVLPGQDLTAGIITELATGILALDERPKALDGQLEELFAQHPQAEIIRSMPGFGPFLGASLLVGAGDLRAFPSAGHLAAAAGLVPVPPHREPAPAAALQPPAMARVLPLSADQHDAPRPQPGLLPEETSQRCYPQPGRHRPRPPPHRRPVGPTARQPYLDRNTAEDRSSGLTTPLRFPVPGHRPVRRPRRPPTDHDLGCHELLAVAAGARLGDAQRPAGAQVRRRLVPQRAAALDNTEPGGSPRARPAWTHHQGSRPSAGSRSAPGSTTWPSAGPPGGRAGGRTGARPGQAQPRHPAW
jgi:transposase